MYWFSSINIVCSLYKTRRWDPVPSHAQPSRQQTKISFHSDFSSPPLLKPKHWNCSLCSKSPPRIHSAGYQSRPEIDFSLSPPKKLAPRNKTSHHTGHNKHLHYAPPAPQSHKKVPLIGSLNHPCGSATLPNQHFHVTAALIFSSLSAGQWERESVCCSMRQIW